MPDEDKNTDGSDKTKNMDKSDGTKNTDKTFDQDSIQHGINIATAKHKKEVEQIKKELEELRKFRDEKELEKSEAEQKELEKKQEYQKIIEKNQKSFDEKETKLNSQIGILEKDVRRLVIDSAIAKLAPELKVIPEAIADFISITAPLIGYSKEEIDGQIKYNVFPSNNGNPMINEKGQEMSLKEFLDKYLEGKPYLRQPLTQGGSGGHGGKTSGTQISNVKDAIHAGMKDLYKNRPNYSNR